MKGVSRCHIVEQAKSLVGTKWLHRGRSAALGVDCVGLLAVIANRIEYTHNEDFLNYSESPAEQLLFTELDKRFRRLEENILGLGMIVAVKSALKETASSHVGILSVMNNQMSMIRADNPRGVVESRLTPKRVLLVKAVWDWHGAR